LRSVGVTSREGCVVALAAFWVVPHVGVRAQSLSFATRLERVT
jgi:hypothetical protein